MTLLFLAGCGGPSFTDISGEVRYNGVLLPNGRISFICFGADKPVRISEIVDGQYIVTKVPEGLAQITVETFKLRADNVPGGPPPPPVPKNYKYVAIPKEFASAKTTTLEIEVNSSLKRHDIRISGPEGKK